MTQDRKRPSHQVQGRTRGVVEREDGNPLLRLVAVIGIAVAIGIFFTHTTLGQGWLTNIRDFIGI